MPGTMYEQLRQINMRPAPYSRCTTRELWTDPYISEQMLALHLDPALELASRTAVFMESSVRWIIDTFGVTAGKRVADFGCGPGLYTTPLARTGADVTGIDFSARALRHARETAANEGLSIDYVLSDYLEYTAREPFDLITLIFLDYGALSARQRQTLLAVFQRSLADDGTLLLDVASLRRFETSYETSSYEYVGGDGFWTAGPHYVFHNTLKYDPEAILLNKFSVIEPHQIRESYNWMQCFSPDSLQRELAHSGLYVTECLSNVAGRPYDANSLEIAVVARKQQR